MLSQSRRGMVSSTSALSRPKLKKKERLAVFPCRMEEVYVHFDGDDAQAGCGEASETAGEPEPAAGRGCR